MFSSFFLLFYKQILYILLYYIFLNNFIYYVYCIFVALDSMQLLGERMYLHVLLQETRSSNNAMVSCGWWLL